MDAVENIKQSRYVAGAADRDVEMMFAAGAASAEAVSDHGDAEELRSLLLSVRKLHLSDDLTFGNKLVQHLIQHEADADRLDRLKASYKTIEAKRKEPFEGTLSVGEDGTTRLGKGRSNHEALMAAFHTGHTSGGPVPELRGPTLSDEDPMDVVRRQNLLAYVLDECAFAVWLPTSS